MSADGFGGMLLGATLVRRGRWDWTEANNAIATKAPVSSMGSSGVGMAFKVVPYKAGCIRN